MELLRSSGERPEPQRNGDIVHVAEFWTSCGCTTKTWMMPVYSVAVIQLSADGGMTHSFKVIKRQCRLNLSTRVPQMIKARASCSI